VRAADLGPLPPALAADGMAATLDGNSFPSETWGVDGGKWVVVKAAL